MCLYTYLSQTGEKCHPAGLKNHIFHMTFANKLNVHSDVWHYKGNIIIKLKFIVLIS